jgi:hypothetical protein
MLYRVTTDSADQRAIAGDLEARDVRWAILWRGLVEHGDPARDADAPLDQYIHARFAHEASFGAYQIWHRKDSQ